jgi:DNA-binding NarL/FixJ family response regulator
MENNIEVLIADDHQNILKSIAAFLSNLPNITVVATAENGEKAVALARSKKPDVMVLDINMPKLNGLEVLKKLRTDKIKVSIVILSIYDEPSIVQEAFNLGAKGYVLKNRATTDLINAIRMANRGEQYVSEPLTGYLR